MDRDDLFCPIHRVRYKVLTCPRCYDEVGSKGRTAEYFSKEELRISAEAILKHREHKAMTWALERFLAGRDQYDKLALNMRVSQNLVNELNLLFELLSKAGVVDDLDHPACFTRRPEPLLGKNNSIGDHDE